MTHLRVLPPVVRDLDAVFQAMCYVRLAYAQVCKLRSADPIIRCVTDQLDEMAGELFVEYQGERLDLRGGKS